MSADYLKALVSFSQFLSTFNLFGFQNNAFDSSINQGFQLISGSFFAIFSLDCFQQNLNYQLSTTFIKALVNSLVPFFMIIFVGIFVRTIKKSKRLLIAMDITLFLLQTTILQSLFNLLKCNKISDNNYFISDELLIPCYTKEYNKWIYYLVLPSLIVFVIIIPSFFLIKIWHGKKNLNNEEFNKKIGFLIHGFKKSTYYWEYCFLWEKIIIIIIAIFYPDIYSKVITSVFFLILIGVLLWNSQPLMTKRLNILEMNRQISLVSILLVKLFKINNKDFIFEIITSLVVFAFEFQYFYQCLKYFIIIKLQSTSEKKIPKTMKKIFSRASRYFQTHEINEEYKEYVFNSRGSTIRKDIQETLSNQLSNEIENDCKNMEIIRILATEIRQLKGIIQNLSRENLYLKNKEKSSPEIISSCVSPKINDQFLNESPFVPKLKKLKINLIENLDHKDPLILEHRLIKWPNYIKRNEYIFEDLKLVGTKEIISFKDNNEPLKEKISALTGEFKVLNFQIINISEENIDKTKLKFELTES